MANTKETKAKEILLIDGKINVSYGHTDEVDILDMNLIPGTSTLFHRTMVFNGCKHSLGDAFDTFMVDKAPATPSQKRDRLLLKWDAFLNSRLTLKSAAIPRVTREEQISIMVTELVKEGIKEAKATKIAMAMVEAIR